MPKYRITFVLTPRFHPHTGGVQMTTYKLAKWFSTNGHEVAVFSFEVSGHIESDFATIHSAVESGGCSNEVNCLALENVLRNSRPDVVINQMPYEHTIGRVFQRVRPPLLLGCLRNTLFSVKNNLEQYGRQVLPRWIQPLVRNQLGHLALLSLHRVKHTRDLQKILETYDYFVMFAPPNLREIQYFLPNVDQRKLRYISNSIPSISDRVPPKQKRLLWLGRVEVPQKRADLIIPIWRKISDALPDWEFDIVGDGPAFGELLKQIARERLERINLCGRQQPDEYYYRSSVFVMTSSFEGFPNTLIEAQSFGAVPVVFNSYPVVEWLIQDGKNGRLVRPFNVSEMAEIIIETVRPENLTAMMSRSLENATRFHVDKVGKEWIDLFDDCLHPQVNHRKNAEAV